MLKQVQNKRLQLLHQLHASFDLLRGRLVWDLTGVREVLQLKKPPLCTLSENQDNHGAVAAGEAGMLSQSLTSHLLLLHYIQSALHLESVVSMGQLCSVRNI